MAKSKTVAKAPKGSAKPKSSAKPSICEMLKGPLLPSLEKLKGLAAPSEVPEEEKAKGGVKPPGGRVYETEYAEDRRPSKKLKVTSRCEDEDEGQTRGRGAWGAGSMPS